MTEPPLPDLEEQRAQLYERLAASGDLRPGSINATYRRCGKPNCEPLSLDLAGLKDVDGLGQLPGPPGGPVDRKALFHFRLCLIFGGDGVSGYATIR
jgi:hypothetical protein